MSGFSFPPPPPPPPKTGNSQGPSNPPQRGAHDRGRGRGRGRGSRGSFHQRSRGQTGRGTRSGPNYHQAGHAQQNPTPNSSPFGQPPLASSYAQPNHGRHGSPATPSYRPTSSDGQHTAESPQRTVAGHKRKLDALRGPPQKKPEHKPAPATAPAIPTFGAPFLPVTSHTTKSNPPVAQNSQPKQKPGARSLGLTPGTADPQYSSDSEDEDRDVDEEAMYAELGDKLTFEHNGVVVSLNSQADLMAWKKDRQKNWPTKARMATKDEEKRKVGEERKRLLAGAEQVYGLSTGSKPGKIVWTKPDPVEQDEANQETGNDHTLSLPAAETDLEKAKREMAEKTRRLEELRRKVTESEERNRKAREDAEQRQNQHEGRNVESPPESPAMMVDAHGSTGAKTPNLIDDAVYKSSDSEPASDDSDADADSDSSSEAASSSEDEAPEETTSKPPPEIQTPADSRPLCRYFRASGWCRDGDACRFRHEQQAAKPTNETGQMNRPPEARKQGHVRKDERPPRLDQGKVDGKKTIFQRLVEQEEEKDDRLALKVVKYLGEMGFFREAGV